MQSLFPCFSPRVLPVLPTASLFLPKIGIYSNSLCCLTFQDFRCTKGLKPLILCGFLSSRDFSENLFSSLKVGITTPTRNRSVPLPARFHSHTDIEPECFPPRTARNSPDALRISAWLGRLPDPHLRLILSLHPDRSAQSDAGYPPS